MTFTKIMSAPHCYAPSTNWSWDASGVYLGRAANVNGDSVADIFFYKAGTVPSTTTVSTGPGGLSGSIPGGNYYAFVDLPGTDSSFDTRHWRATDINGDGLADWVYVRYANPGLTVLSQIGKTDGSLQLIRRDVSLSPAAGPLSSLEHADLARNWFLADIGGGTAGAPDGKADIVIAAYQRGDYATALRLLAPLAEHGNADAQFNLGIIYNKGQGVPQNCAEALLWFRRAADQGVADAQYNLASMYYGGQGVPAIIPKR